MIIKGYNYAHQYRSKDAIDFNADMTNKLNVLSLSDGVKLINEHSYNLDIPAKHINEDDFYQDTGATVSKEQISLLNETINGLVVSNATVRKVDSEKISCNIEVDLGILAKKMSEVDWSYLVAGETDWNGLYGYNFASGIIYMFEEYISQTINIEDLTPYINVYAIYKKIRTEYPVQLHDGITDLSLLDNKYIAIKKPSEVVKDSNGDTISTAYACDYYLTDKETTSLLFDDKKVGVILKEALLELGYYYLFENGVIHVFKLSEIPTINSEYSNIINIDRWTLRQKKAENQDIRTADNISLSSTYEVTRGVGGELSGHTTVFNKKEYLSRYWNFGSTFGLTINYTASTTGSQFVTNLTYRPSQTLDYIDLYNILKKVNRSGILIEAIVKMPITEIHKANAAYLIRLKSDIVYVDSIETSDNEYFKIKGQLYHG